MTTIDDPEDERIINEVAAEIARDAFPTRLLERLEEQGLNTSHIAMSWRDDGWFNFYWVARVIEEREGVSKGVAERTLRELCATGDVRSIRYHATTDEEREPEIIRPSEWVKDQVDLATEVWIWIFVSASDVQYWLDNQAVTEEQPLKKLSLREWFKDRDWFVEGPVYKEAAEPASEKIRAGRKLGLARTAISQLWPEGPPEALANPQIEKRVGEWITAYCKKNNISKPDIGRDTVLRAAGRRQ
jgi:hypothetical protein